MISIDSIIEVARGTVDADLVIKNIKIINVFTQETEETDIAISNGKIVGIGKYDCYTEIDGTGMYAAPGLIDGHVHVESSMMTPKFFAKALIQRGVTSAIADPHEIANVLGTKGIDFMVKGHKDYSADIYYMVPSCVPAVPFEENGAILFSEQLIPFKIYDNVIGLGEVMDVNSVLSCKGDMIKKLDEFKGYTIDGHAPLLSGQDLNAYICAGIKTDHECTNVEEALEKIRRGMYVLIREGSAAKDLIKLLPAVNDLNYHRFLFCTDDRHADDLLEQGSIDNIVRKAISLGLNPLRALTMASYNAAKCYKLNDIGAIAPGYNADILILNDLHKLDIKYVIKNGKVVISNGSVLSNSDTKEKEFNSKYDINPYKSMRINTIAEDMLKVKVEGNNIKVIEVLSGSLTTKNLICSFHQKDGFVESIEYDDVLKIAVFERHKGTGRYFVGYIKGLGLKDCAVAQTISHDSHNIIAVGDRDEDIVKAVNALVECGGGISIASEGEIKGIIELPIAGLMKNKPVEVVSEELKNLRAILNNFSSIEDNDIFLTLGFMSLPVIPHLKITPSGLFDYDKFSHTNLFN